MGRRESPVVGGMVAAQAKALSAPNALEILVTTMPKGPRIESRRNITNVLKMHHERNKDALCVKT